MKARILKINPQQPEEDKIKIATKALYNGGLVIIPTETVYGIAADMRNSQAINQLYKIKQRPKDKPFSLHIDDKVRVEDFAVGLSRMAFKLIDKFWPGPLTLVLPASNGKTVGLRIPDNNIALRLISALGGVLVCPSANLSGKPAPINLDEALKDLGDKVDVAIDGGEAKLGIASSVVDLTKIPYKIQRQGALSSEEIQRVTQKKNVLFVCAGNSCRSVMAKAYLEKKLAEQARDDVEVLSAGILSLPNLGASPPTKQILEKEGIDVEGHKALRVTRLMIKKSDIILVMNNIQKERILELAPEAKVRLFLLKEFTYFRTKDYVGASNTSENSLDIDDPMGRSIEFYEHIFSIIKEAIDRLVKIL